MSEPTPVTAMPSSNSNPVMDYYQRFCDKTPFVTRTLTVFIVVEYILSFFIQFEDYLGNVTRFTILGFEIYRVVLSSFVGNSILTLIILLISYPSIGSQMEWSMGSSSYLYLMCIMSIATNLLFNAVCLLLILVVPNSASLQYSCQGFWIILFSLITIDCMGSPDAPRRLLFIPIDIPSKYMPIAMYALFSLFGGPSLSFALAILVGYGSKLGYLDRVKPTSYYLEQLESNGGCLHSISRASGWVLASTVGHDSWIPVNANTVIPTAEPLGHSDSSSRSRASEVVVQPFPGQGRKLASSSTATAGAGIDFSSFLHAGSTSGTTSDGKGIAAAAVIAGELPSREDIAARRLAAMSAKGMQS